MGSPLCRQQILMFVLNSVVDMQKCVDTLCQNVIESIVQERY